MHLATTFQRDESTEDVVQELVRISSYPGAPLLRLFSFRVSSLYPLECICARKQITKTHETVSVTRDWGSPSEIDLW